MKFEYFIAKRIIGSKSYKSSVSAPIIKIGIAAIAIGIIVMLIAIATGIGLQQKIRDKAVAFNGHLTISSFDSNISEESLNPISSKQEFYPNFNSVPGVSHIQVVAHKFGVIRTESDFEGMVLKGVGFDYNWSLFEEFLIDGRLPEFDNGNMSSEVLIPEYLAKRLVLNTGDSFQMYFARENIDRPPSIRKFNIVGIYRSGFLELDETYLMGDIRQIQRLNSWESDQIGHFELFISDYDELKEVANAVYQNTPSVLNTETVSEKYASIFEWISIFDKNIYGIIGIMILVAGINMITALLVLILERTQMIGILKALGSRNWNVQRIFLINAAYLILLGLFWGNLIGIGLLVMQQNFGLFPLDPEVYYVTQAPVYLSLSYVLSLNLGTFLICLLMLMIPSMIISRISPVKAMRFE
ncbi:MAG: ABC transporter permease [Flavobacteriaceae bacterium]|nr:FtsX-like permease family protein [Bacteroidia bacterium]NNF82656.1 ABC transporter permease [Flavobacteriaceae bacterium]NNK70860.1 ABC transporter permease [Flavobacteriaceae bacterium]